MSDLTLAELIKDPRLIGGAMAHQYEGVVVLHPIAEVVQYLDNSAFTYVSGPWSARRVTDEWSLWSIGWSENFGTWLMLEQVPGMPQSDESIAQHGTASKICRVVLDIEPDVKVTARLVSDVDDPLVSDQPSITIYYAGHSPITPADVVGMPDDIDDPASWNFPRLELDDDEWEGLISPQHDPFDDIEDEDHEYTALPACCANVSEVRSCLSAIYSQDKCLSPGNASNLTFALEAMFQTHDIGYDKAIFDKIESQLTAL